MKNDVRLVRNRQWRQELDTYRVLQKVGKGDSLSIKTYQKIRLVVKQNHETSNVTE